jgi:soluble cytochrome b562
VNDDVDFRNFFMTGEGIGCLVSRMKFQPLLWACLMGMSLCLSADDDKPDLPLAAQMSELDDAYKALKKETDVEKGAAAARSAQQALLKGMAELPEMVKKMPDGSAKAAAAVEYRKLMAQCYVIFCEIEQAFLAGKIDQIEGLIENVKAVKKTGHQKFIED